MNDQSQAPSPVGDAPLALPRQTTPTWEVELLISGIAVFAMLQLAGALDDAVFAMRPRFSQAWAWPVTVLYIYAKTSTVILAATFILHLTLRARWIALVGLLSVHPGGIAWDKLRLGRIALEVEKARARDSDELLDRADNIASVVFAAGVTVAILVLGVAVIAVIGLGATAFTGARPDSGTLVLIIAVAFGPLFAAQALDRKAPTFVQRHPRLEAGLRRLFRVYTAMGLGAGQNPAMAILASNSGRRKVILITIGIMFLAILAVTVGYIMMRDQDSGVGSYSLFPAAEVDSRNALVRSHYDDQRNPARDRPEPYIQSAVVEDPYLRLVVPYVPVRDEPVLRAGCPAAGTPAETDEDEVARSAAALACLQALYPLELDGKPLEVPYEVGSDPRTDRPSLVAMIDVRGLARGRHELVVGTPPKPRREAGEPAEPQLQRIPFWR